MHLVPRAAIRAVACAALLLLASCAADEAPARQAKPLAVSGTLETNVDGLDVVLDYAGAQVTAALQHRIAVAGEAETCVPELEITVARADGSCRLDLVFRADFSGLVRLDEARFHAVAGNYDGPDGTGNLISLLPCEGWPTEPKKNAVVIYELIQTDATLSVRSLPAPGATSASADLLDLFLAPTGSMRLKYAGRMFEASLDTLIFKGDAHSTGSNDLNCEAVLQPLPSWKAKDIQPASPGFGAVYGLEQFKGKRVAIVLVQGWCSTCIAQVKTMETMRKQLLAQRDDFVMVAVNGTSSTEPILQKSIWKSCSFPVFQDTPSAGVWGAHKGKKNDAWVYDHDGTLMAYFPGADAIDLNVFSQTIYGPLSAKR